MWLFTKYGFFSTVCARQGEGSHGEPVDPGRIMIRGRRRGHLEDLQRRFAESLSGCEILETPTTDYRYRMFVQKSVWSEVLVALSEEMDYDNFKSKVAVHQGAGGADYEQSLHDVWSVMHRLQSEGGE